MNTTKIYILKLKDLQPENKNNNDHNYINTLLKNIEYKIDKLDQKIGGLCLSKDGESKVDNSVNNLPGDVNEKILPENKIEDKLCIIS